MADERWVVAQRADPTLLLAPGVPGWFQFLWVHDPQVAVRYVSREVAELAGKYLLPLTPTEVRRVR